jgi:hypothetical protein
LLSTGHSQPRSNASPRLGARTIKLNIAQQWALVKVLVSIPLLAREDALLVDLLQPGGNQTGPVLVAHLPAVRSGRIGLLDPIRHVELNASACLDAQATADESSHDTTLFRVNEDELLASSDSPTNKQQDWKIDPLNYGL